MAYQGYEVPIALGQMGLQTDGAQSQLPPNAAITANNVTYFTGVVSKSNGSSHYNSASLGNPIVTGFDWWPTASQQRMVVGTSDGRYWKDTGDGTFSSGVPLVVNETQIVTFSAVPDAGAFTFKWNGNNATTPTNWNDSLATVQADIRTITGLSTATVYAETGTADPGGSDGFRNGFTVVMPGTSTTQPLITDVSNSLTMTSNPVTITVTRLHAGSTNLGTISPDAHFCAGGNEQQGNPRRLFIYTGGVSQLSMMTGDSTAITPINRPAADWVTTFPTYGMIYNNRHIALLDHNIYISKLGDHTDFTTSETDGTGASQFPIFPGEGDGLTSGIVFKGGLLLFKKPFGMYLFQWNGGPLTDPTNVSITRISDSFAVASPHAVQQVVNDLFGGSNSGSFFSQTATNAYGSLEAGDLLQRFNVRNYFRQNLNNVGLQTMTSAYYPDKLIGMFTGRSSSGQVQDRIVNFDMAGQTARMSVETKDQPTCMWMRKDGNLVPRPYYGANDGFVFAMDQNNVWNVNGQAFLGEFQTPYINFSFLDPKLADKNKLFDFLNVTYQPIGTWAFFVDVYVDGVFIQTLTYNMKQSGAVLDHFELDVDTLGATGTALQLRIPLKSCNGKAISFRMYNGLLNQSFTIEQLTVSFRESGEQNRSSK